MPKRVPADYELIAQVYEETQSKAETARRLGLHYNTVDKGLRRLAGLCSMCGHRPANPGKALCEHCRVFVNTREARKRSGHTANGECFICGAPVDAPHSRMYCPEHRAGDAERRRERRKTHVRTPVDRRKTHFQNLRTLYGENAVTAWLRDEGTCQSCGTVSEKPKGMHIHHIDLNRENNAVENLVVLCSACHLLFHKILRHPNAGAVIAWATKTYPNSAEKFHDLAALTVAPTPTGRSA